MTMGTTRLTEFLPFSMCSTRAFTGTKSCPGLAVPDSVHHLKLTSSRNVRLRWTAIRAMASPAATSVLSSASSIRARDAFPYWPGAAPEGATAAAGAADAAREAGGAAGAPDAAREVGAAVG